MKNLILLIILVASSAIGQPLRYTPITTNHTTGLLIPGEYSVFNGDGTWHFTTDASTLTGIPAPNLVGKLPALDGSLLTNININIQNPNLSNANVQFLTLISNVPPLSVNQPLMNGVVSTHSGSHYWTNSTGAFQWVNAAGQTITMHPGDYLTASNNPSITDQHLILDFPVAGVAYTWDSAPNTYSPGVAAVVNPASLQTFDTLPREAMFITDAGDIGIRTFASAINFGFFFGGGSNWYNLAQFNDTSGLGLCWIHGTGTGNPVVFELYDGAPTHSLDVFPTGTVRGLGGIASKATNPQLIIQATGFTNNWTNNACAYVTCSSGSFTNFDNAGTPTQTNTSVTFTNQL